jgi:hypothetical protein
MVVDLFPAICDPERAVDPASLVLAVGELLPVFSVVLEYLEFREERCLRYARRLNHVMLHLLGEFVELNHFVVYRRGMLGRPVHIDRVRAGTSAKLGGSMI